MNLYSLTKEELIARCRKLRKENNTLREELNTLSDCYTELENKTDGGESIGILQRVCKNQGQTMY